MLLRSTAGSLQQNNLKQRSSWNHRPLTTSLWRADLRPFLRLACAPPIRSRSIISCQRKDPRATPVRTGIWIT